MMPISKARQQKLPHPKKNKKAKAKNKRKAQKL
jgi:hypothetical protein